MLKLFDYIDIFLVFGIILFFTGAKNDEKSD